MTQQPPLNAAIIAGSAALCVGLGTVHGFSVFLAPLEARLSLGRGLISLTYSLALVAITASVLLGPRLYGQATPRVIASIAGLAAALGVLIAGYAPSIALLWLGYSVIFGAANGLGYGFSLQFAAQTSPGREGLAMGIVTAAYALGAALSPGMFERALAYGGFQAAMTALAMALVLCAALTVLAYGRTPSHFPARPALRSGIPVLPLWLIYGAGVLAGLMAIGHAAGIAQALAPAVPAWLAPVVLAASNFTGSLIAGRLVDTLQPRRLLMVLPALSTLALLSIALLPGAASVFLGLAVVGFAYGGTIAAYPAVIAKRAGAQGSAALYGRVFTAWGAAGLAGPWLAGVLYDVSASYQTALLLAACVALLSALGAHRLLR